MSQGESNKERRSPGGKENNHEVTVKVVEEVAKSDVALREEAILKFWRDNDIFNKTLETPAGAAPIGNFVFYDGPPFATGLPHYGHILAGTMKDAIPRFWTMKGYRVERKWGWDCHGLPLENLIEKELGLGTKRDIETYGVKNFNERARGAVMRYADEWRTIIPRMGRFVDMENDYKTMDSSYTESVWSVFKSLHDKELVFEGFKSMHLCPRCGTTLSNFEVNQGYKDIKDIAVTVKLPLLDDAGRVTDTSLLVWTTTPWTLPGNMAAAVNQDFEYVKVQVATETGSENYILAKGRLAQLGDIPYKMIEELKGSDLVGRKYEPPFNFIQKLAVSGDDKAWTIYHADYVELGEDGTGAVHIAPAYGEEDMVLGQNQGVPIVHHVDEAGHFKDFITDFAGLLVKPKDDEGIGVDHKDTDIEILRALQKVGKIFKKENISHSYPHCWRCETPLLNYATTSWFVNVPKIKDQLIAANETVKWVPEHVGANRFGKWLEGARDWAVSRQRYWGAPLPVWKNKEANTFTIIGSVAELKSLVPKSGNEYLIMRHAESQSNVEGFLNGDVARSNPLTEQGIEQVNDATQHLRADIDYVFYSPLERTKQTALRVVEALGLPDTVLVEDIRLRESGMGELEGRPNKDKVKYYATPQEEFTKSVAGIETLNEVKRRMGDFLYDIERTYQGKKILIISHGDPLTMLEAVVQGLTTEQSLAPFENYIKNAEVRTLDFTPLPHNDNYDLDLHRPYIDDVPLYEAGVKLERVPDVFDCWFESGSMPYGQHHYPFADKDTFLASQFPAEFIAEGLDQTRGWFYSLMVLGVALFGVSPFKHVAVNGLVLAEDGKKMSKSLKNYPDPMELANRTGVDAIRMYLLSSPVVRGEDLNFSEKEVMELQRKNIGRLHNVLAMYELFADGTKASDSSDNPLDRWVLARLQALINDSTSGYERYEFDKAVRPITDFIDDVSVWYLRRSRDRLKGDDVEDKQRTLATLRYTLETLALVMAPVMPFYAEYLWQAVKEEAGAPSVHLGRWPESKLYDPLVIEDMSMVREFVSLALEARTKANSKVRQPLAQLSTNIELAPEYAAIVADEINVKTVRYDSTQTERVVLDVTLTPELLAEGIAREFMRGVQERRKAEGFTPQDRINVLVSTDAAQQKTLEQFLELIAKTVGAANLTFAEGGVNEIKAGDSVFLVSLNKV
jgi:isoleucyl-tRNA synthetase